MLKHLVQTLLSRAVMIPIGIVTGVITARYFGPADRGLFTLLLMFPQTANVFSNLGLDTASIFLHRKHRVPLGELLANCVIYGILAGVLSGLVLWGVSPYLMSEVFTRASTAEYTVAIATIPALLVFQYMGGLARGAGRFDVYNARSVLEKLLFLICIAAIVVGFGGGILACLVAHLMIVSSLCVWMAWDLRASLTTPVRPSRTTFKRMMAFGGKTYAQSIAAHTHYKVDLYLIAGYLSSADVAFYAIGAGLAERCLMLPDAIGLVMFPKLASQTSEDAARLTARVCRTLLLLGSVTAAVLIVLAEPLVTFLYGDAYIPAVGPMYVLLAGVVMVGITRVLMRYITSIDEHHHNVYIVASAAVVNIVLNLLLIPRYGMMGAATASLVTYSAQALWALIVFWRLTGLRPRSTLVVDGTDLRDLRRMIAAIRVPLLAR